MRGARTRTDDIVHAIDYLRQYSHTFAGICRTVRLSPAPQCTIRAHFGADSNLEELWREWKVFSGGFRQSPGVHSRNVSVVKY